MEWALGGKLVYPKYAASEAKRGAPVGMANQLQEHDIRPLLAQTHRLAQESCLNSIYTRHSFYSTTCLAYYDASTNTRRTLGKLPLLDKFIH